MNNTWPLLNFSVLALRESSGPKKKKKGEKTLRFRSPGKLLMNEWINKMQHIHTVEYCIIQP